MGKNLIFIGVIILTLFTAGCSANSGASDSNTERPGYSIIEKADLNDPILEEWYEKSYKEFGYHFTSDDKGNRYLVISAGERPTGGYGLVLNSVVEGTDKVTIVAELKYPQKGQMVTQVLTYPHLLIKANFGDKEIDADISNMEETRRNVTGSFTGRIDNDSVEIHPDYAVFTREGKRAFTLNEETRAWFDANSLEANTRLKFDVLKNSNGQLVITKVKASGDDVEEVIKGYFEGRIDSNFIEVTVNQKTQTFKLSEEFQKTFDPSLYDGNKEVAMLCLKDKTYKYVVLDMKPVK